MNAITVGCDPELFLQHQGKNVSAHGLIPGTKEAPHPVELGAVQVDGMAVEFNINPADSSEVFRTNIRRVMEQLSAMLPEHQMLANPVAHFDPAYMAEQPPEALELGCEADYNAYTGEANPRPDGAVSFRTGGGHVHVGWTTDAPVDHPEHVEACQMLVRELDFMLGIPSLFWDEDDQRRTLYGNPGALRVKSYGVEYRSLSNAWLRDDRYMDFVFSQVQRAYQRLVDGESYYSSYRNLAQLIMTNNDRTLAKELIALEPGLLGDSAHLIPLGE